MEIQWTTPIYKDGQWVDTVMHYGRGDVNMLVYLLQPFRDGWELFGLIHSEETYMGFEMEEFSLVSVFGKREELVDQSDEVEKEKEQIAAGKTAIVLFYGTDNSSYMRRMTPEEYDKLQLITYRREKDDLYYNS